MSRFLYVFATVNFILSLVFHACTFILPRFYDVFNIVMIMHLLIFIPFFPFVFSLQKLNAKLKVQKSKNPFLIFKLMFPDSSILVKILVGVFFAYTMINFYLCLPMLSLGTPEIDGTGYVANYRGEITVISEAVFHRLHFTVIRMFSGHWIMFSFIPAVWFYHQATSKPDEAGADN